MIWSVFEGKQLDGSQDALRTDTAHLKMFRLRPQFPSKISNLTCKNDKLSIYHTEGGIPNHKCISVDLSTVYLITIKHCAAAAPHLYLA